MDTLPATWMTGFTFWIARLCARTGPGDTSRRSSAGPVRLQKRGDLSIERVRLLEVRRVPGRRDADELGPRHVPMHDLGQLRPDVAVLVARQEQRRHARR